MEGDESNREHEHQHQEEEPVNMLEDTVMSTEPTTTSYDNETRPTFTVTSEVKNQDSVEVHRDLESMANDTLEVDEGNQSGITISVCGHLQKGSGLTKYTVYLIKGEDRNGVIQVYRRFNQFYELREAMKQRWPGCFIPAVPDKNAIAKNDEQVILNRERFLNDFVRKIAKLPYLYYAEEFQTLIRSKDQDISVLFQKWPKPSYEDIIIKYRDSFGELSGKEINKDTATKILSFANFLKMSQAKLPTYKQMAKSLAVARSQYDTRLASLFGRILPDYEKTCLFEYSDGREDFLMYANPNNAKMQEHANISKVITKKNPYWLIYDLIKLEERDGQAFLEAIQSRDNLQAKRQDIQIKIRNNEREIEEINMGKSTFKSITSRGSKDQIKYRLQLENKELTKDKDNLLVLTDIVTALQAYITIDQYRLAKKRFYTNSLKKITGYEINFVQNMIDIWTNCEEVSGTNLHKIKARNESAKF